MIEILKLLRLEHCRSIVNIILFYKTVNNLIRISSNEIIPLISVIKGHNADFIISMPEPHPIIIPFSLAQLDFGTSYAIRTGIEQQSLATFKRHLNSVLLIII